MRLIAALSLVLLLGVLGAQCVEHRHGLGRSREIILHNRIIDTKAEDATTDFSREGAEYFYVTFKLNFAGNKENIDQFAEDYGVIFDSFYPMTTYTVYTSYAKAEAISQDAQVLWLGEVPPSDKVPTGLEASSLLVIHWAKAAAEFPGLTEEFADVVARMAEVFPADAFTWSDFNSQSNTAKLQIVDESSFRKIVGWLLTKGSARVKFVDAMPVNTPSSAFATHVVVDGSYDPLKGSGCSTDGTSICLYDTYLNGGSSSVVIDGTGEIIGLVDSGVDVNNCLFYDANFDFNTCDSSNRKIVCYNSNSGKGGNQVDDTGHGSFAAGLACGAAGGSSASADEVASNSAFNGVAPGAQLFVSDVQAGSANSITFDYSNIGSYLDAMYSSGSRIGLFPWGAQINLVGNKAFYSGQDQAFDNYAHAVSDFLFVAPVGNNGLFSVAGTGRIDSPASAKNVIGVGGSLNSHYSFMFSQYLDLTSQAEDLYTELCTIGDFSAYYSTVLCTISGQSSTPCTSFQNVLCFGAFSEPTPDACCQAAYTRPQCCPDTVLGLWSASYSLFSEDSGYPQSSRGPTFDYRIKPDVVAPAQRLFSAASSPGSSTPYCDIWSDNIQPISAGTTTTQAATVNEGTSFSAAVVAGTAALIRQYLRAGFYPFGDPAITGSQTFANPSAALIRAIMVNGADSLFQYNANNDAAWKVLSDYISPEVQGHGRINLLNTLMIEPTNIVTTVLFDSGSIPYTNATDKYFFRVPDDTPFIKVTLVWTDPAAAIGAGHALVNNLDVALVRDDGFEYRANRLSEFDYNNNVEHIYAPAPAGRTYSVTVHGAYVPSGPQSYALVISGSLLCPSSLPGSSDYQADQCILDNSEFADAKCPLDCSLRLDACSNGICYCSSPYYGIDCSLTPCPNNCNNNGVCDGETGTCTCNDFWKGDDCSEYNESGNSTNCIYKCPVCDGVNIGITIGVSIGAFLLGLLIAFPFGVWLATHLMLKRKKKMFAKMRAAQQHAQQAQPLHENIEHDSDDE